MPRRDLWTYDPLICLDNPFMMTKLLGQRPICWLILSMSIYSMIGPKKFDKLKWTFNCVALMIYMYSFWLQLFDFYCFYVIESCSSIFDKLLCSLMGFNLSSSVPLKWLMHHEPILQQILEGYSSGIILHLTWYNHSSLSSLFILFYFVIFVALFYFYYFLLSFWVLSFFAFGVFFSFCM